MYLFVYACNAFLYDVYILFFLDCKTLMSTSNKWSFSVREHEQLSVQNKLPSIRDANLHKHEA